MPQLYEVKGPETTGPRVFLATPGITLHPNYLQAMIASIPALAAANIGWDWWLLAEACHVDDARNALVRRFMMTEDDMMIFLDADVGWTPEALVELIQTTPDVVGGIYPLKDDEEGYPVQTRPGEALWSNEEGLVEVQGLPTGFMKLTRTAIKTVTDGTNAPKFWGREDPRDMPPHRILFERLFENGVRYSGDYGFCLKWARLGGKMYTNPRWFFSHRGAKDWAGDIGHWWRRQHGVIDMEWRQAVERVRQGKETPRDFLTYTESWGNHPFRVDNDLLDAWIKLARDHDGLVLECGSGLTSILGAAAHTGTYIALEHDPFWAAKIRGEAERLGIDNLVVITAPLKDKWYDISGMLERGYDPAACGLVLVDGPPASVADRALVNERLNLMRATVVVFDDAARYGMDDVLLTCAAKSNGKVSKFKNGDMKEWAIVAHETVAFSQAG